MTFRLGVVTLNPVPQATLEPLPQPAVAPAGIDDATVAWLFDPTEPGSLLSFWKRVTSGHLDVVAEVNPARTVRVDAATMTTLQTTQIVVDGKMKGTRSTVLAKAVELLTDEGLDLKPYDGLVVFVNDFPVDAGSWPAVDTGERKVAAALLDRFGFHAFMAHELGHVFGFDHPFDIRQASATYPTGEYQDYTDIMGLQASATMTPVPTARRGPFTFTTATGFDFWSAAGPGISMATLWRYQPDFPGGTPWLHQLPVDAPPTKVTLTRPGRPGTHLVVMPGWVEGTWHTAEYRPATGWDAGLDTFGFAGVVVHTIKDNGAGQVVNYDSVIAVPGADLDWSNILFSVRVLDADADTVTVLVGRALPDMAPVVTVDVSQSATVLSLPGPSRTFKVGPRCEPREFPTFVEERHVTVTATAQSAGFDRPRFRFDVNGVPLGSWLPRTGDVNGTFDIPVTLSRPAQPDGATVGPATIRATVSARRNVVILTLPSGDGTYDLTVTAHATDDGPAELVAASETITVTTLGVTVPPEVYPQMTECVLAGLLEENLRWPPDPDEHPDWEQELEMLARATINPQLRDPIVPAGVIEFARRLRLPVGDVDRVVRQARRQPNP